MKHVLNNFLRGYPLVTRFALASLIAFVATGAALAIVVLGAIRSSEETAGQRHSEFVAHAILQPYLKESDISGEPLKGKRLQELREDVNDHVLSERVRLVKVWGPDGLLYSNDRTVMQELTKLENLEMSDHLSSAFAGKVETEVTTLQGDENKYDKHIFTRKALETYVPLQVEGAGKGVDAVAEIYQDYQFIQGRIDRLTWGLLITLLLGLVALYLLLLPILRQVGDKLSRQNVILERQAARLKDHLDKERETVAALEELNRLKDDFIARTSHELRTPLTAIIGSIKMLMRHEVAYDDKMREEFLRTAERQADDLHGLVETLLTIARLESGRVKVAPDSFSLPELVDEVIETYGAGAERVHVTMPPSLPPIWNDRSAVRQIFANLLDNAMKFSPEESSVDVGAAQVDGSVALWVRDRGVGIPKEKFEQIFDRFYQVDSSATRTYAGLGLGLSLVKDLLRQAEGSIEVSSRPGEGSTFTITLPLRHSGSPDVSLNGATGPTPEERPREVKPATA